MYHDDGYAMRAARARASVRDRGYADCIHYAPNWQRRVDAIYALIQGADLLPGSPALLADGRMVVEASVIGDRTYTAVAVFVETCGVR